MEAAVVSVAHGAMASLLRNLGDLLTEKYKLLKGARGEVMFLKAELESMHAFLKKMSDAEDLDEQAKCWVKEIRELSYDIDDSVNEFLHLAGCDSGSSKPRGFKGFINRSMSLLTNINTRSKVAKEFRGLRSRVMEVSERHKRYKIDDAVTKPKNTNIDLRLMALYAETAGLVGIYGPRDELILWMDGEGVPADQLKVLSIVGFGGLGKTTLANQIYRKLQGQFQCQAFVSVSQKPNMRRIMRTILSQIGVAAPQDPNMEIWEEFELITALREFLWSKRYLIVIDDIWEAAIWHVIRCAFPENKSGSRVLTTTRIESVAGACCTDHCGYVYKMQPLSEQNSRRLFFKRVFGPEGACPPYLEEVSLAILKKCGGLPLAIITTSSLLATQPNNLKEHWEHVRNSLSSNFEVNPSLEGMRHILNLSYINLPYYLKSCMLYLGIYPEDYRIKKNDLARQWVAEGFISKFHGIDPEDVAKSYFNELINRSMIQPIVTDYNSEVMFCKVHDMMLDLVLHKSREDNFTTVIDDIGDMARQHDKIRRLSLHLDGTAHEGAVGPAQLSQIRTLARFGTSSYLPPFPLFKHLRVLTIELGFCSSAKILDFTGICHLFQLRYLKILGNAIPVMLPSKIGGLLQLETFHIETEVTSYNGISLRELPSDIVDMSQLLHMIVPEWKKFPDGIGNMKSLHTLGCIDLGTISPGNIKGLGELTNLTNLEIGQYFDDENSISDDKVAERAREVLRTCLEKLCNLKYLDVASCPFSACLDVPIPLPASCSHLRKFHTYFSWFSRVPGWIGKLVHLSDLMLHVKEVREDDVEILAQLPSLTHLNLRIRGALQDKIIIRGSGFPALQHFELVCSRISYLTFEPGAMAKLESLYLVFSAQGWDRDGVPPAGIELLSGLKEISVDIECAGTKESDRRAAESALRNAVNMHPRRPTANIVCQDYGWFVFDDVKDDREGQGHDASSSM